MRASELAFLIAEVCLADGNHEAPVLANGAALQPCDAEVEALSFNPGIQIVLNK